MPNTIVCLFAYTSGVISVSPSLSYSSAKWSRVWTKFEPVYTRSNTAGEWQNVTSTDLGRSFVFTTEDAGISLQFWHILFSFLLSKKEYFFKKPLSSLFKLGGREGLWVLASWEGQAVVVVMDYLGTRIVTAMHYANDWWLAPLSWW